MSRMERAVGQVAQLAHRLLQPQQRLGLHQHERPPRLVQRLPPQDVEQAPASAAIQGQEHPVLILDADEGITADPNVRKALNLAVDKQAIAENRFADIPVALRNMKQRFQGVKGLQDRREREALLFEEGLRG